MRHEELGRLRVAIRNSEQVVKVAPTTSKRRAAAISRGLAVWAEAKAADYLKNLDDLETNKLTRSSSLKG